MELVIQLYTVLYSDILRVLPLMKTKATVWAYVRKCQHWLIILEYKESIYLKRQVYCWAWLMMQFLLCCMAAMPRPPLSCIVRSNSSWRHFCLNARLLHECLAVGHFKCVSTGPCGLDWIGLAPMPWPPLSLPVPTARPGMAYDRT